MTREEIKEALDNKQIVCYRVRYDLFNEIMVIDVFGDGIALLTPDAEKDCCILKNS